MWPLETERCWITPYVPDRDLDEHWAIYDTPEMWRYLGWDDRPDRAELERLFKERPVRWEAHTPGSGAFPIRLKADNAFAGIVLLKALPYGDGRFSEHIEIGWHLARKYWGRGLATEAARAIRDYGFETLRLERIYAIADPDNTPSLKVMERIGMTFLEQTDRFYDEMGVLYVMDRATWEATRT